MDFDEDDDKKRGHEGSAGPRSGPGLDDYLEMVRKEAFKDDEGAILLDPDINIKEKFDEIELPCNQEDRINNSINAPLRPGLGQDQQEIAVGGESGKKRGPRGPINHKTYDTDTDTNPASGSEHEDARQQSRNTGSRRPQQTQAQQPRVPEEAKSLEQAQQSQTFLAAKGLDAPKDPLNFENSLKEAGLDDLDDIIGMDKNAKQRSDHLKRGIVGEIVQENRKMLKK